MTRLNLSLTLVGAAIYLFFSSVVLPPSAHAAERSPPHTSSTARPGTPAKGGAGRPFLWKIEGPKPSWLFGTIHSADPAVAKLPTSVLAALGASRSFHPEVELSAELATLLAAKLFTADTPNLSSRLSPTLWVRVRKAGANLGLPDLVLERLTPGLATLFFSAPLDTDVTATVDGQLHARAVARQLPITALETLDEQLAVFEKLTEPQAIAALTEALDEAENGRPKEKKLLRAYASGDEQALAAALEAEFATSPAARALAEPLLYGRNRLMADRLRPHLAKGGAFVGIGAAHLVGPKSVIEFLRARGVTITRVP